MKMLFQEVGRVFTVLIVLSCATLQPCRAEVVAWGDNTYSQTNIPPNATNLVAIAAGVAHSIALQADGNVVAWGRNGGYLPSPNITGSDIVAVSAGESHNLALRSNGSVAVWGTFISNYGSIPSSATNVTAIAAGYRHNLLLRRDGRIIAWGALDYGQSTAPSSSDFASIAAGSFHSLGLRSNGTVMAWGAGSLAFRRNVAPHFDQATVPKSATNIVAIAAGAGHSLALRDDGTVLAWGDNRKGQSSVPAEATNIVALAAGTNYSLALRDDGTVIAWGLEAPTNLPSGLQHVFALAGGTKHSLALLGDGRPNILIQPHDCSVLPGALIPLRVHAVGDSPLNYQWLIDGMPIQGATNAGLSLHAGFDVPLLNYQVIIANEFGSVTSSVARVSTKVVEAWGSNSRGQLGVPLGLQTPLAVSAGAFHSLAVMPDGSVVAWGKTNELRTTVPPDATNVISVAAGGDHSLALTQTGKIIGWGRNWDGQIDIPISASNVTAIAAGKFHSVALLADGKVIAWGNNELDQTKVPASLSNVTSIAAGYYHTLALRKDHTVVSWGLHTAVPAAATNVVNIAAGWGHSLVLRADGTVIGWGDNSYGQSVVPLEATNVVAIAAGYYHNIALRRDGTMLAWGKGFFGVTNIPVGLTNVSAIAAGEDYTMVALNFGPPRIQNLLGAISAHVGETVILRPIITASGSSRPQWNHNGSIDGATNSTLFLPNVQQIDAGDYTLEITSAEGVTNAAISITVVTDPYFEPQTAFTNVLLGADFCLSPAVLGDIPSSYHWIHDGQSLSNAGRVSGATSQTLCIAKAEVQDGGDYHLIISNGSGSFTGLVAHVTITPLIGWGDNFSGQLDYPPDLDDVISIAAGDDHCIALRADGTVVAWGDNWYGQCTVPESATNVVALSAAGQNNLALRNDGTVIAWGDNTFGQNNVPANVTNAIAISTSGYHCLALRANGNSVATWGTGFGPPLGNTYTAVAAVGTGAAGLTTYGVIRSYGLTLDCQSLSPITAITASKGYVAGLLADSAVVAQNLNYSVQGGLSCSRRQEFTNVVALVAGDNNVVGLHIGAPPTVIGYKTLGLTNAPPDSTNLVAITACPDCLIGVMHQPRLDLNQHSTIRNVNLGDATRMLATTVGSAPGTYQWQMNGTNLAGATESWLYLPKVSWTNAGTYRAIVTDAFGSVTGPGIELNVIAPSLQFDVTSSGINMTTNGLQLKVTGTSGVGIPALYASTNLVDWELILTNVPTKGSVQFLAPTDQPTMFYRASEIYGP